MEPPGTALFCGLPLRAILWLWRAAPPSPLFCHACFAVGCLSLEGEGTMTEGLTRGRKPGRGKDAGGMVAEFTHWEEMMNLFLGLFSVWACVEFYEQHRGVRLSWFRDLQKRSMGQATAIGSPCFPPCALHAPSAETQSRGPPGGK